MVRLENFERFDCRKSVLVTNRFPHFFIGNLFGQRSVVLVQVIDVSVAVEQPVYVGEKLLAWN